MYLGCGGVKGVWGGRRVHQENPRYAPAFIYLFVYLFIYLCMHACSVFSFDPSGSIGSDRDPEAGADAAPPSRPSTASFPRLCPRVVRGALGRTRAHRRAVGAAEDAGVDLRESSGTGLAPL